MRPSRGLQSWPTKQPPRGDPPPSSYDVPIGPPASPPTSRDVRRPLGDGKTPTANRHTGGCCSSRRACRLQTRAGAARGRTRRRHGAPGSRRVVRGGPAQDHVPRRSRFPMVADALGSGVRLRDLGATSTAKTAANAKRFSRGPRCARARRCVGAPPPCRPSRTSSVETRAVASRCWPRWTPTMAKRPLARCPPKIEASSWARRLAVRRRPVTLDTPSRVPSRKRCRRGCREDIKRRRCRRLHCRAARCRRAGKVTRTSSNASASNSHASNDRPEAAEPEARSPLPPATSRGRRGAALP